MIDNPHCIRRADGHANSLIHRLKQFFSAAGSQPHNADIATTSAPGFDHITVVRRKARCQNIVDLRRRTLEMLRQLISAQFNLLLLVLFAFHKRLDKILNGIAE